jgi:hypothetical protein
MPVQQRLLDQAPWDTAVPRSHASTPRDVALGAGMHPGTVNEQTARRVVRVARDLGDLPNSLPMVMLNRRSGRADAAAVRTDDDLGIELAAEHLIGLGHRRTAHLGARTELSPAPPAPR